MAALNFPMALAWQIFFGGPLGRLLFRCIQPYLGGKKEAAAEKAC